MPKTCKKTPQSVQRRTYGVCFANSSQFLLYTGREVFLVPQYQLKERWQNLSKKLKYTSGLLKFPENWEMWTQHLYKKEKYIWNSCTQNNENTFLVFNQKLKNIIIDIWQVYILKTNKNTSKITETFPLASKQRYRRPDRLHILNFADVKFLTEFKQFSAACTMLLFMNEVMKLATQSLTLASFPIWNMPCY